MARVTLRHSNTSRHTQLPKGRNRARHSDTSQLTREEIQYKDRVHLDTHSRHQSSLKYTWAHVGEDTFANSVTQGRLQNLWAIHRHTPGDTQPATQTLSRRVIGECSDTHWPHHTHSVLGTHMEATPGTGSSTHQSCTRRAAVWGPPEC